MIDDIVAYVQSYREPCPQRVIVARFAHQRRAASVEQVGSALHEAVQAGRLIAHPRMNRRSKRYWFEYTAKE